MEFWGVEVKPGGKKVACNPGEDTYLHVTQVALGEITNGKEERVVIRVEIDGKQVVLGTLTHGKCDQMNLDLIFDKEFKLYHNGTLSSVYVCGYKTDTPREDDFTDEEDDEDDLDDDLVPQAVPLAKAKPEAAKAGAKLAAPVAAQDEDDEMDEDDDEDADEDGEEESSEEEEETKHESKKRAFPATTNKVSPAPKKAKNGVETPEVKVKGPVPQPASDGKAAGQKGGKKGADGGAKDAKDAKDTKTKKSPVTPSLMSPGTKERIRVAVQAILEE